MKPTCQIQWINRQGQPTPDTNPSIGTCYIIAHIDHIPGRPTPYHVPESQHFHICAEHAQQLNRPGMQWWRFEPLPPEQP